MADYPDWRLREARRQGQAVLIDFINADLDLAFTFLEIAQVEGPDNPLHTSWTLPKAFAAVESIRHFIRKVEDSELRRELFGRADQLEEALARYKKGRNSDKPFLV